MITVKVRAVAGMAKLLEGSEQSVSLEKDSRIVDLLDALVMKYGQPFAEKIYKSKTGEVNNEIRLLLNGRDIAFLNGLDTKLKEGDSLSLIPPLAGG